MAISRERDTATHQPRDTKARRRRRRILGRIAEPPALSVCGACAGRRRQTDVLLWGPQGGAAQRSAGRGSGERAPPAHPASREPGRRAARSPAAAARPSSAAGSPAATWTRVRRPRAPSPRAGPRSSQPTPAQVRAFPSLSFPSLPTPSPGLAWAAGRRDRHLHHGSGDHPGHHLPGCWHPPPPGRVGAERWRTKPPTAGRALAGSWRSPGPRWRPWERGPVCARGGLSCEAVGPPPVPSRLRPPADLPRSQPAPPLRSADRRRRRRRRVGRGQAWAAGLRGLGDLDPGLRPTARGRDPCSLTSLYPPPQVPGTSTWHGGVVVAGR